MSGRYALFRWPPTFTALPGFPDGQPPRWNIAPGARVRAGQTLGRIDNSGDARYVPTHLHFGISWPTRDGVWWVRRGTVYPWPYLDSWRAGGNRSPALAVRAALAAAGRRVPPCHSGC